MLIVTLTINCFKDFQLVTPDMLSVPTGLTGGIIKVTEKCIMKDCDSVLAVTVNFKSRH